MNKSSNATVTRILRGFAVAATGLALGAYAGTAVQDGTDFVITADSGETYTYSTALGNYSRLVKRGAGEAVLDTASSGFAGSVVIEAGTLTIAHKDAVGGTSGSITVQSGATLHLKLPGATQFGHNITIAGKGVNDAGALRYTRSNSSGNSDSLINNLTLSDDATIDVSSRWGVASSKAIELNGHTLTRIGTSEWMVMNRIKSTGAPGEVNNVYGKLTLQGAPIIDENVTVVVTNIDASSYIALWSVSASADIKGTIKVYNGRNIQPQSGTSATLNHIGPLHLAGDTASVTLNSEKDSSARAMSVDGAVTGDNGVGLTVSGKGSVWFNNAVTLPGTATIQGGGNVYFNGDVSITGNTTVTGNGTLSLGGENAARNMKLVLKGNTTTTHEAGKTFLRMLRVANSDNQRAQLRQTGGVIGVPSSDGPRIGETVNQRAYYTLEDGEFHASNTVFIAEKPTSFGAFRQTGGFFESYNRASGGTSMFIGRGGNALFVQTGGTNDISHVGSKGDQTYRAVMGSTNGVAEVTISGAGAEFRASGFMMGNKSGVPTTNILNIANGAKLKVNRFRKNNQSAATALAVVNANGGILAPTMYSDITGGESDTKPNHFVVWENGFVVDTTENSANNATAGSTGSSTVPFAFEKPTGKGVESITLPDLTGTNYIGLGRIVIEDATGWGASAYAEFDFTTKKLTHVVVTSRGCNYSDNAKAYLESPAGTTRYECVLTLSDNTGRCGQIVKRGAPDLVLSSTTSTVDGGYAVKEGMLRVASVPESAIPVRVEAGATLNFSNKSPTFSTFEGAGTVTNGTFTVTDAVRAKCADIFANKSATFTSALTLGDNAVFEITDAENLSTYKNEATAVALTATSISRQPALLLTNSNGTPYAGSDADQWVLARSSDGKTLKFGCPKPFTLVVR